MTYSCTNMSLAPDVVKREDAQKQQYVVIGVIEDINEEKKFISLIKNQMNDIDAIILQDYNKGNLTKNVIEEVIFVNKIGRIRDIQVQAETGKIFLLSTKSLWVMEKDN